MKKKRIIPILAGFLLLAVLLVPIPGGSYDDGGTREWNALTYKIVVWNKLCDIGGNGPAVYKKTRFYGPADKNKSIGELWEREYDAYIKPYNIYTGEWLDKSDAEPFDNDFFSDIIITEIYADCFFAKTVIPMPYQIKLNGTLSDEWCVGDQVICTYENTYYDRETQRVEADVLTVEESNWEPEPFMDYKPVIYLYPQEETDVSVTLDYSGTLTCTYPAYRNGWQVTASPDGTLSDENGQTYSYLYWEGMSDAVYDFSKGFCVAGEDTAAFLEEALAALGLNRREANEFIVFWLPMMQENPYNIIAFQKEAYTDSAKLSVTPAPDTLIRVFMAYFASDVPVSIEAQELSAPVREGFTVIEWGGSELPCG